jgi:acid phosphatase
MLLRWFGALACFVTSAVTGPACADDKTGLETMNATLWMQVSPEYRAIARQVYEMAGQKLAAPSAGSAALEQSGASTETLARLPTAVILDLDETVLDNTAFQARLLRDLLSRIFPTCRRSQLVLRRQVVVAR